MKEPARLRLLFAALAMLAFSALAPAVTPQDPAQSSWTPPTFRKLKTILAPKPTRGHNIFRGEAEMWLADVVKNASGGALDPIDDKAVSDYVSQVGNYLVTYSVKPEKKYQFIVTKDPNPDSMTAGGGRVFITLGMLNTVETEDELAGILAHEIAHDAFAHAGKTVTRQMFWMTGTKSVKTPAEVQSALEKVYEEYQKKPLAALGEKMLGFSRFDELQADRAAFYNTYKAGYNPYALAYVLKRLARQEKKELGKKRYRQYEFLVLLFGSHPPTAQRTMALSWESIFVKMPAKDSHYKSSAFDAMKLRVPTLSQQS